MPQSSPSAAYIAMEGVRLSRPIGLGGPFVRQKRVEIFRGLDLELPRRGLVPVTGGPGAGKSSLLLLLSGALRPDAGRIIVDGIEPWRLSGRKRRRAFAQNLYLGQNPALWHLAERAGELGEAALARAETLVGKIADDAPLAGMDRWRRLALALGARAALEQAALLLDDPFAGLGPSEREPLISWIAGEASARLVVVADPGRGFLEGAAERVVEL
ncbi:MAG: ATP-binding cassette domain-containing protein [bacterium]|nr:ATP-binding cassette domain-containing protein [bacterium]